MHFNFHLSGDESPEQTRRIANAVLALGGLTSAKPDIVQTHIVRTGEISPELREALKDGARANVSVGYRVTEGATPSNSSAGTLETLPPIPAGPDVVLPNFNSTGAVWVEEDEPTASVGGVPGDMPPPVPTFPAESAAAIREPGLAAQLPTTDKNGLPWDERIHSSSRAINADGTWRYRKNVPDEIKQVVEAELRGLVGAAPAVVGTAAYTITHVGVVDEEVLLDPNTVIAPPVPIPPIPAAAAPLVPSSTVQRSYSDVVNLIIANQATLNKPELYVAVLGMSLPEFAAACIAKPELATAAFNALDEIRRS